MPKVLPGYYGQSKKEWSYCFGGGSVRYKEKGDIGDKDRNQFGKFEEYIQEILIALIRNYCHVLSFSMN
jgi:hypothetical protein